MAQIKSFKIKKGSKIGGYKVQKVLGRGWEGEVYECTEGATGAKRAIKLFPAEIDDEIAYVMHYAWFLEELSHIGITPRYYHMGIEFDYEIYRFGFAYIVQELIEINPGIRIDNVAEDAIYDFRDKLKAVHGLRYALGDWDSRNQVIDSTGKLRKLDFDPGKEDKPNTNIKKDVEWFNRTFRKRCISF